MPKEDRRTIGTVLRVHHWSQSTSLPWRYDYELLPDNAYEARKRLAGLKRRLQRNPEIHQKYTDQMQLTITKG